MITSVPGEFPYSSPRDFEAALNARFKQVEARTGQPAAHVRRQFAYDRLLSRLMAAGDSPTGRWVLKGGVAMLSRLRQARHTRDVDLAVPMPDSAAVLDHLQRDASLDLGDFFTFSVGSRRPMVKGIAGVQVTVTATLGRKTFETFSLDIVTSLDTIGELEMAAPLSPLSIPGLRQSPYVLYPLVDSIADKTFAMLERHGPSGTPSTRYRDLVDVVLVATTRSLDLGQLAQALIRERLRRNHPMITSLEMPDDSWVSGYERAAADVPGVADYRYFDQAWALAKRLIDRVLDSSVGAGRWDPQALGWVVEEEPGFTSAEPLPDDRLGHDAAAWHGPGDGREGIHTTPLEDFGPQ